MSSRRRSGPKRGGDVHRSHHVGEEDCYLLVFGELVDGFGVLEWRPHVSQNRAASRSAVVPHAEQRTCAL